jgi:hypothetical protein
MIGLLPRLSSLASPDFQTWGLYLQCDREKVSQLLSGVVFDAKANP